MVGEGKGSSGGQVTVVAAVASGDNEHRQRRRRQLATTAAAHMEGLGLALVVRWGRCYVTIFGCWKGDNRMRKKQ